MAAMRHADTDSRLKRLELLPILILATLMMLLAARSASAVEWCHDYSMYRVRAYLNEEKPHDSNGLSVGQLRSQLGKLRYAAHAYRTALPLRSGDVVIIGHAHSGFVNTAGTIDHYVQQRIKRHAADIGTLVQVAPGYITSQPTYFQGWTLGRILQYERTQSPRKPYAHLVEADIEVWRKRTLVNLSITPQRASLELGQSIRFRATAYYADGGTEDATNIATWTRGPSFAAAEPGHHMVEAELDHRRVAAHISVARPEFLVWVTKKGNWCFYDLGEPEEFEEERMGASYSAMIAGPFSTIEQANAYVCDQWRSAPTLHVPGHGAMRYHPMGGEICYLFCDEEEDFGDTSTYTDNSGSGPGGVMDVTPGGIFDGNPFDEPSGSAGGVTDVTPGGVLPDLGTEGSTQATDRLENLDTSGDGWQSPTDTSHSQDSANHTTGSDRDTLFGFTYEGEYIEESSPGSDFQPPRNFDDVPNILRAMGFRIVESHPTSRFSQTPSYNLAFDNHDTARSFGLRDFDRDWQNGMYPRWVNVYTKVSGGEITIWIERVSVHTEPNVNALLPSFVKLWAR
ncbi:MAG: hypothetical protein GY906_00055 [bacterium]|nr:hypothetical protein [bacterium]